GVGPLRAVGVLKHIQWPPMRRAGENPVTRVSGSPSGPIGRRPLTWDARPIVAARSPWGGDEIRTTEGASNAFRDHLGRSRDLLQGLGLGSADRLQPRLAALRRRLGQPDAV